VLSVLDVRHAAGGPSNPASEPALEAMERGLTVNQERGSQVVAVSYASTDPVRAALTANRVVQLFAQRQYEQKRENTSRTLSWISARIAELKQELERNDAALQRYRVEHALPEAKHTDVVDSRVSDLNHELTSAETDLAARQSRLDYFTDLRRRDPGALVGNLDPPVVADLRHQESALRRSVAELTAALGVSHPEVRRAVAQLQEVERRIPLEIDRSAANLRDDVRVAAARVHSLRDQLAGVQETAAQGQQAEVGLRDLERQTAASRQLYDALSQRREQLREQQEMTSPDARILSLATPPDRPSSPPDPPDAPRPRRFLDWRRVGCHRRGAGQPGPSQRPRCAGGAGHPVHRPRAAAECDRPVATAPAAPETAVRRLLNETATR
jgi:polysaccharide biosynthesis transport protein